MRKGFLCALVVPCCFASATMAQDLASTSTGTPSTASCALVSFDQPCAAPASHNTWAKADYLFWWTKNGPLPGPVLTTGTPASNGILGDPDTRLFYSPGNLDYYTLQGGRITVGAWMDPCQKWGVEASGFMLQAGTTHFASNSDERGFPLIAFPIIDGQLGTPSSQLIANLNQFAGNVEINSRQQFWGAEANVLYNLRSSCNSRFDLIAGYRQLGLSESLQQRSHSTLLEDGVAGYLGEILLPGESLTIADQISTNNNFYGGQLGARYTQNFGKLDASLGATVALGVTHESFNLEGSTGTTRLDGITASTPGGLYVLGTNAGYTDRNRFSYVPEVRADLAYHFNDQISVGVGYTFIYWSRVARPGDQIDPVIDRQQLPSSINYDPNVPATHPARRDADTGFWAQGISLSLGIRY